MALLLSRCATGGRWLPRWHGLCATARAKAGMCSRTHDATTASSSPTTSLGAALPTGLEAAIRDVSELSEVQQAAATADTALRHTLLARAFEIVTRLPVAQAEHHSRSDGMGKASWHAVVGHTLLARHAHITGDVPTERSHRVQAVHQLAAIDVPSHDADALRAALARAHLATALCCLRARGPEMRLAAAAAAASAEPLALCPQSRLASALLSALAAGPSKRTLLLSALTAVENSIPSQTDSSSVLSTPDIAGYARYFVVYDAIADKGVNVFEGRDGTEVLESGGYKKKEEGMENLNGGVKMSSPIDATAAEDHALALVTRWDARAHDFVEALVLAAQAVRLRRGVQHRDAVAFAEDLLTRAVREAGRVGNAADKAEPLLGLASLYAAQGAAIEAEGFFRAVEDALEPMWRKSAFTVASAHLYARSMWHFATFLDHVSVDGRTRTSEANQKRDRAHALAQAYPQILGPGDPPAVPPWFVESLLPHFDLSLPL